MAEKSMKVERYSLWKARDGRIMMVDWVTPGWAQLIVLNPPYRGKRKSDMGIENFGTFFCSRMP